MEPIFTDSLAKVYHSNFQDILETLQYDLIITDPPYNIKYKYIDYSDNMNDEDYINMLATFNDKKIVCIHYLENFCGNVGEALGIPQKIVTWCYNSNLNRQSRGIAWYRCKPDFTKVSQEYKNPNDKRIQKRISEGKKCKLYDWWNDIQLIKNISKEKNSKFTNQIPIKLLERIILLTTKPGDTILDPFFGSGSLYFACKNTGRKCIGIEQSKKHIDIFLERLQNQI